jgi:hypothetical protein
MTDLPVTDRFVSYVTTGGETLLDADWRADAPEEFVVTRARTGAASTLIYQTDYTVEGLGENRGFRIVLLSPSLAGDAYAIEGLFEVLDPVLGTVYVRARYVLARWRGQWVAPSVYAKGDAVRSGGSSYISLFEHTSDASTEPGLGASWPTRWDLVAAKGNAGSGLGGASVHEDLFGLSADDHPHYLTNSRGDARYDPLGAAASVQDNFDLHIADLDPHSQYLKTADAIALTSVNGVSVVNFLTGADTAKVSVAGQTGIVSGSYVEARIYPLATATHSVDEHIVEEIDVYAHTIVPGAGFTITARTRNKPLTGAWSVIWTWR